MADAHIDRPRYNVVIPTRHGTMIVNRNDWQQAEGYRYGVGHALLEYGEYVPAELAHIGTLISACKPDPVLLDIGANIGVHTLAFSELAGPRGVVHSFEAQRVVFQMLMGNLALNSIENVHGHLVALGEAPGELTLPPIDYTRPANFGGVSLVRKGKTAQAAAAPGETVPMIALDSLKLPRVDFIKVDVEGMEEAVLRGARHTLDRCRPLMQVEWMADDLGRLPLFLLEHLDYRVFQHDINLLCIPAERYGEITIQEMAEATPDAIRAAFKQS